MESYSMESGHDAGHKKPNARSAADDLDATICEMPRRSRVSALH